MPDYHAWTHRPKELGGTDPIEFPEMGGAAAAYCFASKTSFTQVGTGNLGWVDADTTDSSIFQISTTTVTNDTIDITGADRGLIAVVCYAAINTPANDWGIGTAIASANPSTAGGGGFGATVGSYNGLALGAKAFEVRFAQIPNPSDVVVSITRAGSAGYAGAWCHIAYWPLDSLVWTDIL